MDGYQHQKRRFLRNHIKTNTKSRKMPPGHPPKTSQNRPKSPPRRNFFALKFRPRFGIDFFTFWAPSWGRLGPQDGTSYTPKSIQKSTPKRGAQKHGSRSLPRPPKTPPRSPRDLPRPSLTPPWPPQTLLPDPPGPPPDRPNHPKITPRSSPQSSSDKSSAAGSWDGRNKLQDSSRSHRGHP